MSLASLRLKPRVEPQRRNWREKVPLVLVEFQSERREKGIGLDGEQR